MILPGNQQLQAAWARHQCGGCNTAVHDVQLRGRAIGGALDMGLAAPMPALMPAHVYTGIPIHMATRLYASPDDLRHTCLHIYTRAYTHVYTCMHTWLHTCQHTCPHACPHTYIPTHIPTHLLCRWDWEVDYIEFQEAITI